MVEQHRSRRAALTLLTAQLDEPKGYGRILRDGDGKITGIVEEKDASDGSSAKFAKSMPASMSLRRRFFLPR